MPDKKNGSISLIAKGQFGKKKKPASVLLSHEIANQSSKNLATIVALTLPMKGLRNFKIKALGPTLAVWKIKIP